MVQTRLVEVLLPASAAEESPPESLLISLSGSLKTGDNKHKVCACLPYLPKHCSQQTENVYQQNSNFYIVCIASWLGSQGMCQNPVW
jgi:hypothetical protein